MATPRPIAADKSRSAADVLKKGIAERTVQILSDVQIVVKNTSAPIRPAQPSPSKAKCLGIKLWTGADIRRQKLEFGSNLQPLGNHTRLDDGDHPKTHLLKCQMLMLILPVSPQMTGTEHRGLIERAPLTKALYRISD